MKDVPVQYFSKLTAIAERLGLELRHKTASTIKIEELIMQHIWVRHDAKKFSALLRCKVPLVDCPSLVSAFNHD
ncbi:hypothetical protein BFL28_13940 [Sphingomonas turrisvirgatae]|uniref:Uncharacterized protein n=1 Tax=Sphingomonas turrisvirgatae TaxID=1888892 RepID=A0A1E3LXC5_9SPHN|nr:hypothetical protein BFL28_13940 [Sphingomonas turrisvirgatae]